MAKAVPAAPQDNGVRERILEAAYDLFAHRGVRAVGVDEVVERARIAKATLYRHFASKDALVLAFLERREQRWTYGFVQEEVRRRAADPEGRLLAIFDAYDEWFHRDDYEACPFVNVLLEMGPDHVTGVASARHLENLRLFVRDLACDAGLRDADDFAWGWHILMKGAIVAAAEGDREAAKRAKALGRILLAHHR